MALSNVYNTRLLLLVCDVPKVSLLVALLGNWSMLNTLLDVVSLKYINWFTTETQRKIKVVHIFIMLRTIYRFISNELVCFYLCR
jgi:hypothetical protein